MLKSGQKQSQDPVQQKLRVDKKQWNKEVSAFIDDLINAKWLMNGKPSKFHMEKSSIINPIPADPASILGVLAGDFQEIAQKGNDIIGSQINYSKNRRKKQPKTTPVAQPATSPTVTQPEPGGVDLTKQLSLPLAASLTRESLIVEGSNPLSRIWSFFNSAIGGDSEEVRIAKYRTSLLRAAKELDNTLKKVEGEIVQSTPGSIFTASRFLTKAEDNLFFITEGFTAYRSSLPKNEDEKPADEVKKPVAPGKDNLVPSTPTPQANVPTPPPFIEEFKTIKNDFFGNQSNFRNLNQKDIIEISNLISAFVAAPTNDAKAEVFPKIVEVYNRLVGEARTLKGVPGNSLGEIFKAASSSEQLNVLAQNFLSKWLRKTKHKYSPLDKTSAFRLDILKMAEESREILDSLMNSLEKDLIIEELEPFLIRLNQNMMAMRKLIRALEVTIKGKKLDKPFMDMMQGGQLGYDFDMTDKQKQQLEKMLDTKRLRELSNVYYRK